MEITTKDKKIIWFDESVNKLLPMFTNKFSLNLFFSSHNYIMNIGITTHIFLYKTLVNTYSQLKQQLQLTMCFT